MLMEINNVSKTYRSPGGGIFARKRDIHAVSDVSLDIEERQTVAIVGESGCGKSTLARLILGLEEPQSGAVKYRGQNIHGLKRSERRTFKKGVQAVFQDPYSSLSPRMRVWELVMEPAIVSGSVKRQEVRAKAAELLHLVGLGANSVDRFPHQFSGGQRQRIAIARSLSVTPELVVLDEPVSALDVSVRAQTLNLLADLRESFNVAFVFISHDLAVVAHFADVVHVMYLGEIVESGPVSEVFTDPKHPYTRALLASVPRRLSDIGGPSETVEVRGEIASAHAIPTGCPFHPRCPISQSVCLEEKPVLKEAESALVACHAYGEWWWSPTGHEHGLRESQDVGGKKTG